MEKIMTRMAWIDDINGWNFLGGKDGQVMESTDAGRRS